jgi:alpha-ketoglutarate-dependent taurine dioxygenase
MNHASSALRRERPAPEVDLDDLRARLAGEGWVHLPGAGWDGLDAAVAGLGASVLHRTDVVARPGRALVTSDRALDLHTDHHRADLIAWLCLAQTSEGGETRLADAAAAYAALTPDERASLDGVRLFEHSVFPGDEKTHPLVEHTPDGPRFYCSFWFGTPLAPAAAAAFGALQRAVHANVVAALRLAPGDLLVIDNRRILHGRTAITGSRDRHLVRSWLAVPR